MVKKASNTLEWSTFCREYAKNHNISYKQALTEARSDYYKAKGKETPVRKPQQEKPNETVEENVPVEPKKRGRKSKNVEEV